MGDLLWPGEDRCGSLFADATVLAAMVRVEAAWLAVLVRHGIADETARDDLDGLIDERDVPAVAGGAERGGNPVIGLLAVLRERLAARNPAAACWLHKGLTSQDVLDTALVLCLRDVTDRLCRELAAQAATLAFLAAGHRTTVMVGRTLTQHAVPVTFGLKAAGWLGGVLDAREQLDAAARLPLQLGGAAGTLAASSVLAGTPAGARDLVEDVATTLKLAAREPWHTNRSPFVRVADALVAGTDTWGRIANDVLLASRPEVGELAEAPVAGRGGSSTMPDKRNPVLAVLVRRAALAGPQLAATVHASAAATVDERSDGAWHVEWQTLQILARRTVTAAVHTTELLAGLRVDPRRMAATLADAGAAIMAERRAVDPHGSHDGPYLGAADLIIDAVLDRARAAGVVP